MPTLDGWRAIAIGLVLCAHTSHWTHRLDALRFPLNSYGHLGVDIFFALSGLLICHRLLEEERIFGRISLKGFYLRRAFRIFPPAYLYLGVVALLGLVRVVPSDWPTWWSAVLFCRNYVQIWVGNNPQNAYSAHFWSLAVEEHFYLLLPAVLMLFPHKRKTVLLGLTLLAFAWLAVFLTTSQLSHRSYFWYLRTDLHIVSLLFPAWLAVVLAQEVWRERLRKLLHPALLPVCLLLLIGAKYADKHLHPELTLQQRINRYDPTPALNNSVTAQPMPNVDRPVAYWPMLVGNPGTVLTFVVPLVAPFLILSTLLWPRSPLSWLLETPPFRYVGRLSYSLYLWQQFFWAIDSKGWPIARLQNSPLLGLLLTVVAAIASFYLVERPLIRLGHRLAPPATSGHRDSQFILRS